MISSLFLTVAGLLVLIYFLWSRRRLYKLMIELPGPWGLPFLGSAPEYFINNLKMIQRTKYMDKYGSTILTWIGIHPFILSRDPKIAKDVLSSSKFLNRNSRVTKAMENIFGLGLVTLQEPMWNERRRHLNISFKMNVLFSFLSIFNAETKSLISLMDTFVDQGEINILPDILRWSFKIATRKHTLKKTIFIYPTFIGLYLFYLETIFDTDVRQYAEFQNNEILNLTRLYSATTILNIFQPLRRNNFISNIFGFGKEKAELFEKIDTFLEKVIGSKLNSNPEKCSDSSNDTVINLLIDLYRNGKIDYIDLKGECSGLLLASYETTAYTLTHSLILLAMFPEYQDLVYEELKRVFPSSGPIDVTYEDLQKLEYMDQVFNEILRLVPTVPAVPRELKGDIRLSNGTLIPKGVIVLIDIFNLHRNKDLWGPDADIFNPNNFLPDNMRDRHPSAFMPFAKGRRNCIGSKYAPIPLKIALAMIFWKYKLSTNFRYEDLEYLQGVPICLKEIPLLNFQKRF
ncbi:hypothetical protein KR074_002547 [Drosophila pseudoananassae]|nr:hypothetical protein KR074_002547 [Drosophila pseudoananassae]